MRPGMFRTSAIMTAYFANVRSLLEYGSMIWTGAKPTRRGSTEFSINLSRGCLVTLHQDTLRRPLMNICCTISGSPLLTFTSRRMQHDVIFIRNIFRLKIDCADLLASFALHIPTRSTRAYRLFSEPRARVNTVQSGLFCRLPRVANAFLNHCDRADIFSDTFCAFKRMVIRYVNDCE